MMFTNSTLILRVLSYSISFSFLAGAASDAATGEACVAFSFTASTSYLSVPSSWSSFSLPYGSSSSLPYGSLSSLPYGSSS